MTDEAVFEMMWDCKFCGQKKLLGVTHRFCANCGAPQDPASRYFPPDNEKIAVQNHPFVGADVACPACRQPMGRSAKCCTNCGSPIDKGVEVQRRADVVVPDPGVAAFAPGGYGAGAAGAPPAQAPAGNKGCLVALAIAGAVGALLVVVVLVAVFWKREGVFEVTGQTWQRSIAVERFDVGRKTAWCDQAPSGARELSRHKEQRGTTKVPDGETCQTRKKDLGNGTFKEVRECQPKYRSDPVMSDRCDFEVTEWRTSRTLDAKGASASDPPRWPAVALSRPGTCVGCEREGARTETYTVKFASPKKGDTSQPSCDVPQARWAAFSKGTKWKGKVGVLTDTVDCGALVPQ
jgi:hypothetical protein